MATPRPTLQNQARLGPQVPSAPLVKPPEQERLCDSAMEDPLRTYLHDHLAGATHAIELVESIRDEYPGEPIGLFARSILVEIKADHEVLQKLAEQVGTVSSGPKEMVVWLGEKISRLKLRRGGEHGLGLFESIEFLSVGVRGKWALWRTLSVIASKDQRLAGINFDHLIGRAESQYTAVEECRMELARTTFYPENETRSSAAV